LTAETLNLPPEKVRLVTRDTERTPDSSSDSCSRVTYMSGGALLIALNDLKQALAETGRRTAGWSC
jgi:aldehyde oxidoreductase